MDVFSMLRKESFKAVIFKRMPKSLSKDQGSECCLSESGRWCLWWTSPHSSPGIRGRSPDQQTRLQGLRWARGRPRYQNGGPLGAERQLPQAPTPLLCLFLHNWHHHFLFFTFLFIFLHFPFHLVPQCTERKPGSAAANLKCH